MQLIKELNGEVTEDTDDMIKNQIRNLISMSSEIFAKSYSSIDSIITEFLKPIKEVQGLAADFNKAEQSWNQAFKSMEDIGDMSVDEQIAHSKNMAGILDKTYKDSLKIQGIVAQMEKDQETLQKLLEANADAEGAKAIGQTANQLNALAVQQMMRQQQILAAMARTSVAGKTSVLQNQLMGKKSVYEQVNIGVADPYQPDDANFTRPAGQGWIHF